MSRSRHPRTLPAVACLVAVIGLGIAVLPAAAADKLIVVQAGDTLSEIALEQGVTVAQLVALNGIKNPGLIYVGQRLRLQASAPAAPAAPASLIHVVASGENLTLIAHRYGTSITAIVTANAISNPSFVRIGQRLTIPVLAGTAPAAIRGAGLPTAMAAAVASRASIGSLILAEANAAGVDPAFAMAVAWQESGWRQDVVSSAGAIGVMQLMPATGDWVASLFGEAPNVRDLRWNVHAGVRLLGHYLDRYHGDRSLALAAYYQGERATDIHGIYAVSRPYIASILALQAIFSR